MVLKAADPSALANWYADLLGMSVANMADGKIRVGFGADVGAGYTARPVTFLIEPTGDGASPKIEQWEGRNAIALPETAVRAINQRLLNESPNLIIHQMRELHVRPSSVAARLHCRLSPSASLSRPLPWQRPALSLSLSLSLSASSDHQSPRLPTILHDPPRSHMILRTRSYDPTRSYMMTSERQ